MPLLVELDDGERWRVCSPRARLEVKVRWQELPNELPADRTIEYEARTIRLMRRIGSQVGKLEPTGEARQWETTIPVTAGRFFGRCVRVEVRERTDAPRRASVWLVPKPSAAVALTVVAGFLIALAVRTATTLSTLHLNFSYSHAVTGLGGLTLLGLAGKAVHSVSGQLRLHGLPLYGLGYLLGRTLVVCAMAACGIAVLLPNCVTTLVNNTKAKIELRLPDSPERLELGPDQRVTFLGPAVDLQGTIERGLVEADQFCVTTEHGPFDPVLVRFDSPPPRPGETESCRIRRVGDKPDPRWPLWSSLFVPSRLHLGCRSTKWKGVLASQVTFDDHAGAFADERFGDVVWVDSNDECKPVEGAKADVRLMLPPGDGVEAHYEIQHPWTWAKVDEAARIVVEAERRDVTLRMVGPSPAGGDAQGPSDGGPRLELRVQAREGDDGRKASAPIPTPFVATATELPISLGRPNGSGMETEAAVHCVRREVDMDTHFRLVALTLLSGSPARVLEVRASSSVLPVWESTWNNLKPKSEEGLAPRVCLVAPGSGYTDALASPVRSLTMDLTVSFPRFGDRLTLRLPAGLAAQRVGIEAQSDAGTVVRGSLTCVPENPGDATDYEIGPVWVKDWSNRNVRDVTELLVEGQGEGWISRWVKDEGHKGEVDGWFPPWMCRPAGDPVPSEIQVRTSRSYEAVLNETRREAKLQPIPPSTCYFDFQTRQRVRSCPFTCRTLSSTERGRYNRDLGTQCAVIRLCGDREGAC